MQETETGPKLNFEDTSIAFNSKSKWQLIKAKYIFKSFNSNLLVKLGSDLMLLALKLRLPVKGLIKSTVFDHFCGGETIADSQKSIDELGSYSIGAILDYSVEGEQNEKGFDKAAAEIIKTVEKAAQEANIPFSVFKPSGIASVKVLQKVQAGLDLDEDESKSYKNFQKRFENICQRAYDLGIPIFVDAEETWIQQPVDEMVINMMRKFNKEKCIVYNTYQMYLKTGLESLKNLHQIAQEENFYAGAKLVRGAYMEKESERATLMEYEDPINANKGLTDQMYDDGVRYCVENRDRMSLCAGTHNERSSLALANLIEEQNLEKNDNRIWFAQLYGMSDHISFNLANSGYNVAKYLPYGPISKVMPYLVRRAEENRSVKGQSSRELSLINKELARRNKSK